MQHGGEGGGSQFRPPPPPDLQVPLVDGAGEGDAAAAAAANRWPRQETLALLKIRADMDGVFRDSTLKAPLWEEISRKLGELGYARSSKKCKEKFENVQKYHKRTKDGRSRRQDGKSYRFFSQLEALAGAGAAAALSSPPPPPIAIPVVTPMGLNPQPISSAAPAGVRLSSNTSSATSASDSDDEDTEEVGADVFGSESLKMMEFFEGMMKTVMERQEAMQQKFLDALERKEKDRAVREEAWRRQEAAQLGREHELVAKERAVAASRDAAIISFLQKLSGTGGGPIQLSPPTPAPTTPPVVVFSQPNLTPIVANSAPPTTTTTMTQMKRLRPSTDIVVFRPPPPAMEAAGGFESPSRWPKAEVHALIELRTGMELRYREAAPKGPLWEEISSEMRRLGYHRSPKRCKEKWENINKYYKKVKDNDKKRRPEDAKTCPYYHQLDALYRRKLIGGVSSNGGFARADDQKAPLAIMPPPLPPPQQLPSQTHEEKLGIAPSGPPSDGIRMNPSIGGLPLSFFSDGGEAGKKEKQHHHHRHQNNAPVGDYDNNDDDNESFSEDMEDDEEERGKIEYEIQFQRPNGGGGGVDTGSTTPAKAAAAGSSTMFPAIVQ